MSHVMRRGGRETYPTSRSAGQGVSPAFAFDENTTSYSVRQGNPATMIASASINLQSGSRVKVEGIANFVGSGAPGTVVMSSFTDPPSIKSELSFVVGTIYSLSFLGVSQVQPAGLVTMGLFLSVASGDGAEVDYASATVLTLTEILAS